MRVIIEVDNADELREALALLKARVVEVRAASRRAQLEQIFCKYQGRLPDDYCFDRNEAHER